MEDLQVNGKPAIKIKAIKIKQSVNAILLDCEADILWFPKSAIKYDSKNETCLIQEWLYNQKFTEE